MTVTLCPLYETQLKGATAQIMKSTLYYYGKRMLLGCVLSGFIYILADIIVFGVNDYTYDATPGVPIIGNPEAIQLIQRVLFIVPFVIATIYFRIVFRKTRWRFLTITLCLLTVWAAEKLAIMGISSLIYGIGIWRFSDLLYRISDGGDQSAPWFTLTYIQLTFMGCLLLSLISELVERLFYMLRKR